jgi:hypothetical protein
VAALRAAPDDGPTAGNGGIAADEPEGSALACAQGDDYDEQLRELSQQSMAIASDGLMDEMSRRDATMAIDRDRSRLSALLASAEEACGSVGD